jgi:hypothetical protein
MTASDRCAASQPGLTVGGIFDSGMRRDLRPLPEIHRKASCPPALWAPIGGKPFHTVGPLPNSIGVE